MVIKDVEIREAKWRFYRKSLLSLLFFYKSKIISKQKVKRKSTDLIKKFFKRTLKQKQNHFINGYILLDIN